MNGFERRTELKKKKILNTAFELFSHYGAQKVSIQEIAKSAQVSQVTIYNYFGSKDQLLLESIKNYLHERIEAFKDLVNDPSLSFKEKIRQFITMKRNDALSFDLDIIKTIMSDQPHIESFINDFSQNYSIPLLLQLIQQGKDEGDIHQSLSSTMIMFYIDMYYQAIRKHQAFYETEESIQQFTEEILHLFFYGISGKKED